MSARTGVLSESDPEFDLRDRQKVDLWIERGVLDELNAGGHGAVLRHRDIPVGLDAVLVALPAAGENVLERLRPHACNRELAPDAEGLYISDAGDGGVVREGRRDPAAFGGVVGVI